MRCPVHGRDAQQRRASSALAASPLSQAFAANAQQEQADQENAAEAI